MLSWSRDTVESVFATECLPPSVFDFDDFAFLPDFDFSAEVASEAVAPSHSGTTPSVSASVMAMSPRPSSSPEHSADPALMVIGSSSSSAPSEMIVPSLAASSSGSHVVAPSTQPVGASTNTLAPLTSAWTSTPGGEPRVSPRASATARSRLRSAAALFSSQTSRRGSDARSCVCGDEERDSRGGGRSIVSGADVAFPSALARLRSAAALFSSQTRRLASAADGSLVVTPTLTKPS